ALGEEGEVFPAEVVPAQSLHTFPPVRGPRAAAGRSNMSAQHTRHTRAVPGPFAAAGRSNANKKPLRPSHGTEGNPSVVPPEFRGAGDQPHPPSFVAGNGGAPGLPTGASCRARCGAGSQVAIDRALGREALSRSPPLAVGRGPGDSSCSSPFLIARQYSRRGAEIQGVRTTGSPAA